MSYAISKLVSKPNGYILLELDSIEYDNEVFVLQIAQEKYEKTGEFYQVHPIILSFPVDPREEKNWYLLPRSIFNQIMHVRKYEKLQAERNEPGLSVPNSSVNTIIRLYQMEVLYHEESKMWYLVDASTK